MFTRTRFQTCCPKSTIRFSKGCLGGFQLGHPERYIHMFAVHTARTQVHLIAICVSRCCLFEGQACSWPYLAKRQACNKADFMLQASSGCPECKAQAFAHAASGKWP